MNLVKVLITGGLGGIGQHIVQNLWNEQAHEITIFDIKNKNTIAVTRGDIFQDESIRVFWGDITNPETYPNLNKFDVIVHMAFIIPPKSETLPDKIVEKINVEGTRKLIDTAKKQEFSGKIIFASSVTIYGPKMWNNKPITVDHPVNPTDRYTAHKALCEQYLIDSGLKYLILRVSGAMNLKQELSPENLKMLYAIPYNQRFEFVHPMDVALAFSRAVSCDAENKILNIAGGKSCQVKYHEIIEKMMGVFNIPLPDRSKFTTNWYYIDYYDTTTSQKLLNYQTRTLDNFIDDFRQNIGIGGEIVKFFGPIAKYFV
ncbi:MAG: NAD-dependent epimerase/dehydratase family protein [Candidatus Lokiarchaeota archaeon]|nr:NAD-dependent epimerase/dehydratase family protein [Candidatus Lokiarchaeota archaeon]